jgi:hypothetical protein
LLSAREILCRYAQLQVPAQHDLRTWKTPKPSSGNSTPLFKVTGVDLAWHGFSAPDR